MLQDIEAKLEDALADLEVRESELAAWYAVQQELIDSVTRLHSECSMLREEGDLLQVALKDSNDEMERCLQESKNVKEALERLQKESEREKDEMADAHTNQIKAIWQERESEREERGQAAAADLMTLREQLAKEMQELEEKSSKEISTLRLENGKEVARLVELMEQSKQTHEQAQCLVAGHLETLEVSLAGNSCCVGCWA